MVAYRELTNPLEAGTPVVVRVVRDAPEVIVAVTLAWIVGEIIGPLAARRIVLAGDGVFGSLRAALGELVRRPLATLARCVVPLAVLVAVLVPSLLAAGAAWRTVQAAIGGPDATGLFIAILAFVTLWLIGLLLIAVVSAWRGAVWTVAVVSAPGTFRRTKRRRDRRRSVAASPRCGAARLTAGPVGAAPVAACWTRAVGRLPGIPCYTARRIGDRSRR